MSDLVGNPEDRFSHNAALTVMVLSFQTESSLLRVFTSAFEPRCEKTNVLVSDLVRHITGCTAKEDG